MQKEAVPIHLSALQSTFCPCLARRMDTMDSAWGLGQCPMAFQWSPMANGHACESRDQSRRTFCLGDARIGLQSVHVRLSSRPSALDIHMRWQGRRSHQPKVTKCSERRTGQDWTGLDRTPPLRPARFLVGRHLILQGPLTEIFLLQPLMHL